MAVSFLVSGNTTEVAFSSETSWCLSVGGLRSCILLTGTTVLDTVSRTMAVVARYCWAIAGGVAWEGAFVLLSQSFGQNFDHAFLSIFCCIGTVRFLDIVLALATPVTIHESDGFIDVIRLSSDDYPVQLIGKHLFKEANLFSIVTDSCHAEEGVDFSLEVLRVLVRLVLLVTDLIEGSKSVPVMTDEVCIKEGLEVIEVVAICLIRNFSSLDFGSEELSCEGEGLSIIETIQSSEGSDLTHPFVNVLSAGEGGRDHVVHRDSWSSSWEMNDDRLCERLRWSRRTMSVMSSGFGLNGDLEGGGPSIGGCLSSLTFRSEGLTLIFWWIDETESWFVRCYFLVRIFCSSDSFLCVEPLGGVESFFWGCRRKGALSGSVSVVDRRSIERCLFEGVF